MKDTIDLRSIIRTLKSKILWILAAAIIGGVVAYAYSAFIVTPTYTVNAQFFAQNAIAEKESGALTSADITIRQRIIPSYKKKLLSYDNMERLSKALNEEGIKISAQTLLSSVAVQSDQEALDILKITVVTTDPELSYRICTKLSELVPGVVGNMFPGYTLELVESARRPSGPSSPNIMRNMVLGILIGLILSCSIVFVLYMMDNTVKDADQTADMMQLRFLGDIPDMNETFKGGYFAHGPGR